jgi:hypothetical protein
MVSADEQERNNRSNEQAEPQAPQSPGPAAALGRPFERRLNDLEFAHTLGLNLPNPGPFGQSFI